MVKANEKSLKAKSYINGQVNKFREERRKTSDEEARKQLAENFKKTASSEEYQGNLKIVNEDANIIRKGIKPRERTSENFQDEREKFYGQLNMYLSDDEINELEKKDVYEKIDYLFKKLGDGDKTILSILYLSDCGKSNSAHEVLRNGEKLNYRIPEYWDWMVNIGCNNKFHNLGVRTAKKLLSRSPFDSLLLLDPNAFSDDVWKDSKVIDYIKRITEDDRYGGGRRGLLYGHNYDRHRIRLDIIFEKMGDNNVKKIIDSMEIHNFNRFLGNLPFYIGIDKISKYLDYSFMTLIKKIKEENLNKEVLDRLLSFISVRKEFSKYGKALANACIERGYIDILEKYINKFGLTDEEKSEILGRDIARERFDADLAKLRQLGDKLGLTIEVREKKDENNKNNDGKKGSGWRSWFGKK